MQSVFFSDEVRFALNTDGRIRVWCQRGERYKPQCTVLKISSRFSVMFWGFITPDGSFGLVKCALPDNAKAYRDVLDQKLKKDYAKFGWKLMEDNCPVHRAETIRDYLAENYIQTVEWPPYSPDLNIIENVWR